MANRTSRRLATFVCLTALTAWCVVDAQAQQAPSTAQSWTWTDAAGHVRTAGDFAQIVARHRQWLETDGTQGARADFANAKLQSLKLMNTDLRNAIFTSADLSQADFTIVDLGGADLAGVTLANARFRSVTLTRTNLSGAFIHKTDMPGSDLEDANISRSGVLASNLTGSNLKGANLDHAMLMSSKLNGALLDGANLSFAGLSGTDLADAKLYGADLEGAVFEPVSQPELRGIANARHLDRIAFNTSPDAIAVLRKAFADGGYFEQRNQMTYALRHQQNEQRLRVAKSSRCAEPACKAEKLMGRECVDGACTGQWLNYVSYSLNWILFDWTVRYGMQPEHALWLLLGLWLVCSCIYFAFIHLSTGSGLVLVKRKMRRTAEAHGRGRFRPRVIRDTGGWRYLWSWVGRQWHVFRVSMFFSLLSTFHNGFNEFDPGRWIRLMTKRDYNLEPQQWMRTVAGVQTVLSLFLFAMWVLTEFGHPFEA